MLFALFLSCLLAFAQAKCSLKLTLKDSYGDGWNDNSLTLTSRGTKLALTPSAGFAALNADGEATLSAGSDGSFTFSVEAGEPVEFNYEYTIYANENSWRVELADAFAPFTPVVLTASSLSSSGVPTCENIGTVICGPVAPAVTDVTIVPGVYAQEVKFDWPSLAVSDSDSTVSYTVSFRDIADSNPNNWILLAPPTFQSEISAVFPPSKTVQVQIVAVNQYGAGTPYLFTYTTPAYSTASVWVKLLDSAHNGWGAYNGFVFIQLSNFAYGSLTFPCAEDAICTEISYEVKIPVGVAYTAKFTYQAPSDGGADCSWKILNSAAATSNALFDSQQDAQGPVMKYFEYTVNYPGTPTKTPTDGGTTPTTIPCPGSEPAAGAACTGLTPSGGCAYESSCCCPSEAIAANKYCVSNTYTCSGASGATWQAAVAKPICVADPTFTCPSDCPSTPPASKVGQSCSAALTCNYPTSCGGTSGCTKTATYLCTGSASLVWQTSTACSCTNITSCAAWEILVTSGDCCTTPPYCQTDPSSTNCLTPTAWTTCAPNSGTCGAGTQTRTTYTRGSNKQCLTNKETQSCTIPCPVPCVGAWGNYSSCSVSCGQGIKTRKFTVTQQAQNGGTPCSVADGTVESAQCEIVCAVTPLCTYIVDAFDSYGDGWDTSLVKITYTGAPANLSIKVPFVDGSTSQKTASVNFQVAKDNVVTFTYTLNQEGYPEECSFAVAAGIQTSSGLQRVGSDVLQNPVGLATNKAPTTTVTLKATCVSCANASPAYCAGLKRVTCETAQVADDQCGACLSGYTAATPTSGRTTCTDIDECAATTNPCGSNAICTNIVGSFNCTCQTGFSMINGACLSGSCPTYRLRKEFTDLSDAEKDRFIRATLALGKTFWTQTKNAHAAASTGSANVHVDNWFLPWHRGFLKDVEDAFYVLDGDLRCTVLPYWDWTRTSEQGSSANAITYLRNKIFTNAKSTSGQWLGLGAKASTTWASDSTHPLKTLDGYRANWADLTWTAYGPSAIYGGALTKTNYNDLTTFLVNGGHGTLHGYIGGMMGYLNLAAGDPVFFLHHGFLEVLHSAWQVCKGYTNRDNVPAAAWPTSPHPIGQKMPICLTKTYSWYDLYSNDILKIKFGQSFLTRVSAASSSYCPAGASSGMFAFVEIGKKKAASVYVVGSPVVNNSTGATYTATPSEAAPLGSNNKNKNKNKKERRKVSYKVEKPEETHLDTQNTKENQAALDNYAESNAAFKKVLKETGDVQQAYSASVDVECNRRTDWTAALTTSPQMISDMKMERMCAMGHCYHECYLRQQGRNKNAYKSDYQNKVDKGQEKSIKEWRKSHKKNSCKGEKPTKNKKRGRRAYLDVGFNATMAQF